MKQVEEECMLNPLPTHRYFKGLVQYLAIPSPFLVNALALHNAYQVMKNNVFPTTLSHFHFPIPTFTGCK